MSWIDDMRPRRAVDVALALGLREMGSGPSAWAVGPCPACHAERRHAKSRDHRGAIGIARQQPGGWRCFSCGAGGDAIDLVAVATAGNKYRNLAGPDRDHVRQWCRRWLGDDSAPCPTAGAPRVPQTRATRAPAAPSASETPRRPAPTAREMGALWGQVRRPDSDPVAAAYLRARGIDPVRLSDLEIAGLLPGGARVPRWAYPARKLGLRLVLRRVDYLGRPRTVLFRRCAATTDPAAKKSLMPAGAPSAGMVLACPLAREMLRRGTHPSEWDLDADPAVAWDAAGAWWPADRPVEVVITEGEMDFLAWVLRAGGADEYAPAVIGIGSGWWTRDHAERIPDGARVLVATDNDPAGDDYARRIAATFRGRAVDLARHRYAMGVAA